MEISRATLDGWVLKVGELLVQGRVRACLPGTLTVTMAISGCRAHGPSFAEHVVIDEAEIARTLLGYNHTHFEYTRRPQVRGKKPIRAHA